QIFSGSSYLPRRQFLTGLGALTAGISLSRRTWSAVEPNPDRDWIDIHSHFSMPRLAAVIAEKVRKGVASQGTDAARALTTWNPAELLSQMDRAGIAASVLSLTFPGVWFGENQDPEDFTRSLARECNEFIAKVISDHSKRVGLF